MTTMAAAPTPAPADAPIQRELVAVVSRKTPIILATLVAAFAAVLLGSDRSGDTTFRLASPNDLFQIPDLTLPAIPTAWVMLIGCALLAAESFRRLLATKPTQLWVVAGFALIPRELFDPELRPRAVAADELDGVEGDLHRRPGRVELHRRGHAREARPGPDQSSGRTRPRVFLTSLRRRLLSRRRRLAARLGLVLRRVRSSARASPRSERNRSRARSRLRDWERESADAATATAPTRASSRVRWASVRDGDSATENRTSARVAARLACCPPGPPGVSKRQVSSLSGTWRRPTRRTSVTLRR